MRIELPIYQVPFFSIFDHTMPVALFSETDPRRYAIINNMLQLGVNGKGEYSLYLNMINGDNYNTLLRCPYLEKYAIPYSKKLTGYFTFKRLLVEQLRAKRYVFLCADCFYLPNTNEHLSRHIMREMLIFAIDDRNVYAALISDDDGFTTKAFPIKDVLKGYISFEKDGSNRSLHGIWEFRPIRRDSSFDAKIAKTLIKEYINCENSVLHFLPIMDKTYLDPDFFVFGFDCYPIIHKSLAHQRGTYVQMMGFRMLCAHKVILGMAVDKLTGMSQLRDADQNATNISVISELAKKVVDLLMEYNKDTSKVEIIDVVDGVISEIEAREREYLPFLCDSILDWPEISVARNSLSRAVGKEVEYTGNWKITENDSMSTESAGAYLDYYFEGNECTLILDDNSLAAKYEVIADGVEVETNLNIRFDVNTYHHIRIKNIENRLLSIYGIKCSSSISAIPNECRGVNLKYIESNEDIKDIGKEGRLVFNHIDSLPPYVNMLVTKPIFKEWDNRNGFGNRLAVLDENGEPITPTLQFNERTALDIIVTGSKPVRVSLYSMEFYNFERVFNISVKDGDTGETYAKQNVEFVVSGCVFSCDIRGHIVIELVNKAVSPGVVAAVFVDKV